ncbi:MAG: glycosyltransferase family 2 protein [Flavobacteriales bacterium]|nr:glycosyltransferase family 2 protein [Flavobacteriales bacterium]NNK81100.1 glycosyltransferase family 2 protein [Flavobacteriales bacterium]
MSAAPEISIVIPVYNEVGNIQPLYSALVDVLGSPDRSFEIIFVDDGSSDGTFEMIASIHTRDQRVRGFSLSRNFGHQTALFAGLKESRGDVVITMDGDMQHPPHVIPDMLEEYEHGYSIVNTRRIDSKRTGFFKKLTSRWYYKLINALSDVQIEPASADFRLMTREAVEAMLSMPERKRFTRGLVSWMGFHQSIIDYEVGERLEGKSKFTLFKMLRFGLDGVTSFSVKPLRIAFYIGTMISVLSILYGLYAIVIFLLGHAVPGWTSLLVSILFIGGAILLSLGVVGEYVARIYNEVKRRPMYFIKDSTDQLN